NFFRETGRFSRVAGEMSSDKTRAVGRLSSEASGRPSITWPEAVDEALCFGWIDGLRKTIDAESYKIRFTPRRPTSNWSAINIRRMKELMRERRIRPAGV